MDHEAAGAGTGALRSAWELQTKGCEKHGELITADGSIVELKRDGFDSADGAQRLLVDIGAIVEQRSLDDERQVVARVDVLGQAEEGELRRVVVEGCLAKLLDFGQPMPRLLHKGVRASHA
eukprot:5430554-Prymnesium_polylepis.1